jgi:hypothetical protein
MSARQLGILALVAIAGGLAWFALPSPSEAPSSPPVRPPRAATLTPPLSAGAAAARAPEATAPRIAAAPPEDAATVTPALAREPRDAGFAREPRDGAWADRTERALRGRFGQLRGGKLAQIECRARQCRIVVVGTQAELGKTIAELSGAHGLHDLGARIALSPLEARGDAGFALRAFAVFDR